MGLAGRSRADDTLAPAKPRFDAIAFDGFPIFDPRPVLARAEALFPGKGQALSAAWKARQFEYTWLRAAGGRYADFWEVTSDALRAAAEATGVAMSAEQHEQLMNGYLQLKTWPDVLPVLRRLRAAGLTLAFLTNFTPRMLEASSATAGLGDLITHAISTDAARTYKPDPRAYQLGLDVLRRPKERILFAAFAGWDAVGAKWFGYPTYWVNRLKQPLDRLSAEPDGIGADLLGLEAFALERF